MPVNNWYINRYGDKVQPNTFKPLKMNDPDDWDQGRLLGIEECASLAAIYAGGAFEAANWYAARLHEIEAGSDIPPAWLQPIIKDHEATLKTKTEVAVALCETAYREAKLLRGIK